jgi:hypothetical protein
MVLARIETPPQRANLSAIQGFPTSRNDQLSRSARYAKQFRIGLRRDHEGDAACCMCANACPSV